MSPPNKRTHTFWWIGNIALLVICGLIISLMAAIHALEDETTSALALTSEGRFYLAGRSFLGVLFVALVPAGLSLLGSRNLHLQRSKFSPGWKMALLVWATLVVIGLVGAVGFWLQIHPFQLNLR